MSRDSFQTLFEKAAALSNQLIPLFVALVDSGDTGLFERTGERSFLTGIPVK